MQTHSAQDETSTVPVVAFVCTHNSFRSQVAEALARKIGGGVLAAHSAGTELAPAVNPAAVELARELFDIDMTESFYAPKTVFELPPVDILVTMGCGVACPSLPARHREDWGLTDPSTAPRDEQIEILREIERRVQKLVNRVETGEL